MSDQPQTSDPSGADGPTPAIGLTAQLASGIAASQRGEGIRFDDLLDELHITRADLR